MTLPFRRRHSNARGQALVEMAIMLPVLILLLMLAIDFGRVFFGWVGLNNAVRIAAIEAGFNPQGWNDPSSTTWTVRQLCRRPRRSESTRTGRRSA